MRPWSLNCGFGAGLGWDSGLGGGGVRRVVWLPEQGALWVGDCCEHFLIQFRTCCWSHLLGQKLKYDCGGNLQGPEHAYISQGAWEQEKADPGMTPGGQRECHLGREWGLWGSWGHSG